MAWTRRGMAWRVNRVGARLVRGAALAALACAVSACGLQKAGSRPAGELDRGGVLPAEAFVADPVATATQALPSDGGASAGVDAPRQGARASRDDIVTLPPMRAAMAPERGRDGDGPRAGDVSAEELQVRPVGPGPGLGSGSGGVPAAGPRLGVSDVPLDEVGAEQVTDAGAPVGAEGGAGSTDLLDAKVGEINGRPIRLTELLEEFGLGARLEATAAEFRENDRPRTEWLEGVRQVVRRQLTEIMQDELLAAEARASLTEPQRQGLRAFLEETQENIRRAQGAGSRVRAQQRLAEQGETEQSVVRREERKALIDFELQQRIRSRVRVSMKDIRLYYERNVDEFNPPPRARYRLIRVAASDGAAVESVRSALAGGEAFAAVASRKENRYRPDEGGLTPEIELDRDPSKAEPFPAGGRLGALNEPSRGLAAGSWAGPIELGTGPGRELAWVKLEERTEIRRALSDRDVQLEIERRIRDERTQREVEAYFARLQERASFTSMEEMVERVVQIAAERYWPR